jgi:hypothetical protein
MALHYALSVIYMPVIAGNAHATTQASDTSAEERQLDMAGTIHISISAGYHHPTQLTDARHGDAR